MLVYVVYAIFCCLYSLCCLDCKFRLYDLCRLDCKRRLARLDCKRRVARPTRLALLTPLNNLGHLGLLERLWHVSYVCCLRRRRLDCLRRLCCLGRIRNLDRLGLLCCLLLRWLRSLRRFGLLRPLLRRFRRSGLGRPRCLRRF